MKKKSRPKKKAPKTRKGILSLKDFTIKKRSKTAFEALPKKTRALNFEGIIDKLHKAQAIITVETTELLIVRFAGAKISIFKSGKITVENAKSPGAVKKALGKLFEKISYKI